MAMNQRHTEFFGPDLGRGPFAPGNVEAEALQIATAIAQLRAPITRSDADVLAHGDFIRQLADHLAPDHAASLSIDVGDENTNAIQTTVRADIGTYSLLDIWLADAVGGGVTGTAASSVTFNIGTVLETITANKRYLVVTSAIGLVNMTVVYGNPKSWYWGISRQGRVYYSDQLHFS